MGRPPTIFSGCFGPASRALTPAERGQTAGAVWLAALTSVGRLVGRQVGASSLATLAFYALTGPRDPSSPRAGATPRQGLIAAIRLRCCAATTRQGVNEARRTKVLRAFPFTIFDLRFTNWEASTRLCRAGEGNKRVKTRLGARGVGILSHRLALFSALTQVPRDPSSPRAGATPRQGLFHLRFWIYDLRIWE